MHEAKSVLLKSLPEHRLIGAVLLWSEGRKVALLRANWDPHMSAPYKEAKAGRLVFKGGEAASLDKKKKKQKKKSKRKSELPSDDPLVEEGATADPSDASASKTVDGAGGDVYTIDAAKKMKYEELFPVETKKFKYDPNNASRIVSRSVEEALDDRVKKKADRYCK